jgi:hypothetical protein
MDRPMKFEDRTTANNYWGSCASSAEDLAGDRRQNAKAQIEGHSFCPMEPTPDSLTSKITVPLEILVCEKI